MNDALKAVPIGVPNLRDVPRMLRNLAEQIESGHKPALDMAVMVARQEHDGGVVVFAWGDVPNAVTACGLLQWGIQRIVIEPMEKNDGEMGA